MNLPPPRICQLARKLFAQMGSSGRDADVAREKLRQLLEEHGLTWNDLPRILAAAIDLTGTAGDMQVKGAKLGGIFNMGGTAVANYVSILERLR